MERKQYIAEIKDTESSFILEPLGYSKEKYLARTSRNIGWITPYEQEIIRATTVGIAGCGGMGGLLASTLLRLGIGHLKIADLENFEISNLNRQIAAKSDTLGQSKAVATARYLREITTDTTLYVYPEGIQENTVRDFTNGCDIICDEIEFWAVGSRLLLHKHQQPRTVIFNGNSVGMGTRLFRFTRESQWKMTNILRMSFEEGADLEGKIIKKTITKAERKRVIESVLKGLVPRLPEYIQKPDEYSTISNLKKLLIEEGRAAILATNPPMATGFLANHVLLEILRKKSSLKRRVTYPPDMPGYLYWDAAKLEAAVVQGIWW